MYYKRNNQQNNLCNRDFNGDTHISSVRSDIRTILKGTSPSMPFFLVAFSIPSSRISDIANVSPIYDTGATNSTAKPANKNNTLSGSWDLSKTLGLRSLALIALKGMSLCILKTASWTDLTSLDDCTNLNYKEI